MALMTKWDETTNKHCYNDKGRQSGSATEGIQSKMENTIKQAKSQLQVQSQLSSSAPSKFTLNNRVKVSLYEPLPTESRYGTPVPPYASLFISNRNGMSVPVMQGYPSQRRF